jgi:hypothetical protein
MAPPREEVTIVLVGATGPRGLVRGGRRSFGGAVRGAGQAPTADKWSIRERARGRRSGHEQRTGQACVEGSLVQVLRFVDFANLVRLESTWLMSLFALAISAFITATLFAAIRSSLLPRAIQELASA